MAPRATKKHVEIIAKQPGSRKRVQSKGSKQNKEKNTGSNSPLAQKEREPLDRESEFSSPAFLRDGKKRSVMDHFLKDKYSFDRVN